MRERRAAAESQAAGEVDRDDDDRDDDVESESATAAAPAGVKPSVAREGLDGEDERELEDVGDLVVASDPSPDGVDDGPPPGVVHTVDWTSKGTSGVDTETGTYEGDQDTTDQDTTDNDSIGADEADAGDAAEGNTEDDGKRGSPVDRAGAGGESGGGRGARGSSRTDRQKQSGGSRSRLRSYVVTRSDDDDSSESAQEQDGRISAVDAAGIKEVLRHEREQGRTPEDTNETNPGNEGYDVRSFYEDGELARWIEVKSTAGAWDRMGVAVSPAQFRFAQRDGAEQCWLYGVEYALDPDRRRVWCVQDPAERVTDFMFDDGWKGLADPPGGSSATDSVEATCRRTI